MQEILRQDLIETVFEPVENLMGKKIGVFGKLFGCWHKQLSRPMTRKSLSYRSCLDCGARRKFDTESFKTLGPFFYPPTVRPDN